MFGNLFKPKIVEKVVYKEIEPRKDWFVWEAGQDPVHCLWYCTLCSFTIKDLNGYNLSVSVEECETFSEAIEKANKLASMREVNGIKGVDSMSKFGIFDVFIDAAEDLIQTVNTEILGTDKNWEE